MRTKPLKLSLLIGAGVAIAGFWLSAATGAGSEGVNLDWIKPGADITIPQLSTYRNELGRGGFYSSTGPVATKHNAFFEAIGPYGRACVSCHQPADGMSLSVPHIQERWTVTEGRDPIFEGVDGANCPSAPPKDRASHSLLLERGLFRVGRPWPPRRLDGTKVEPEFDLEVVRDPTGCNADPVYGLKSANPTVSVYRRPRPVGNIDHILMDYNHPPHPGFKHFRFLAKGNEEAFPLDPKTGELRNPNIMWDGRFFTVEDQLADAASNHQGAANLTPEQASQIAAFVKHAYLAQAQSNEAGDFTDSDAPELGPAAIAKAKPGIGNGARDFGFAPTAWDSANGKSDPSSRFKQSVMRGYKIFNTSMLVSDIQHINSNGLGNPTKRSCALCHVITMTGSDSGAGWLDLGTQNAPWAREDLDLPLFKLTCKPGAASHVFLGPVIYTHDPGRALVSGRCDDIGAMVAAQLRGLAARAPYFSNGSAADLKEVVDFYDRRFNLRWTEQQKVDLANFLGVL